MQITGLLRGRKTYLTCWVLGLLLFGSWQGWWQLPSQVTQGLTLLALAFIRSGIKSDLAALQSPSAVPIVEKKSHEN